RIPRPQASGLRPQARNATAMSWPAEPEPNGRRATSENRALPRGMAVAMGAGMRISVLLVLAACGSEKAAGSVGPSGGGASAADAGVAGCLSSNECPTGWTCNDFHMCEQPPPMLTDGGVPPPETEYTFGQPTSSQRFVYVAMTSQNELARIDGRTL